MVGSRGEATGPTVTDSQLPQSRRLRAGDKLGRYVIRELLGEGGMGVVYSAYDPDLDRRVALKMLRGAPDAGEDRAYETGTARLMREAQAMAQLSHPNVLPIFDVGRSGARVFIATEIIDGSTLAQWNRQRERPWREVVAVFRKAGKGLVAAHRQGLIHRDFKPDNVLISASGVVRVMDFGLARRRDAAAPGGAQSEGTSDADEPPRVATLDGDEARSQIPDLRGQQVSAPSDSPSSGHLLEQDLTRTGSAVGTVPYMAPEHELGQPASEASDQYAFCVSLFESLYGLRPFQGRRGGRPDLGWRPPACPGTFRRKR
ncbi:MAG: serine/threonine protein kinase [Proteobacteria bacterium]|nr:serine/threonine protein kinase [Pseudomonadota bacterium]